MFLPLYNMENNRKRPYIKERDNNNSYKKITSTMLDPQQERQEDIQLWILKIATPVSNKV